MIYETPAGITIEQAAQAAVNLAKAREAEVAFEFNGITLTAAPESTVEELCAFYDQRMNGPASSPFADECRRIRLEQFHQRAGGVE